MPLTAVLLSCAAPGAAAPEADPHLRTALGWYERLGVVRVALGVPAPDDDAAWSTVFDAVAAADILVVAAPVADADRAVVTLLLDRLGGAGGQVLPLAGAVACLVVAGQSAGSDPFAADTVLRLSELGAVLPPAAVCTENSVESMAQATVTLATQLGGRSPVETQPATPPRTLFGSLPTGALGIDPAVIEAERLAAEQGRLYERRRMLDLTRPEKGLPENRRLERPSFDDGPPES